MDLMLIILKSGETIVSQSEQLEYEPKVHLEKPHLVGGKTKVTLTPWPAHAGDQHILLHSDSLLTVCEPSQSVKLMYLNKIDAKLEDFEPKTEEPVLLNEGDQSVLDDDYEPHYVEDELGY